METLKDIEKKIISIKPFLKEEFGVEKIGCFGSFATGQQTEDSDIDILITYNYKLGWKFFDLKEYLESEFGREVDLVTERSLKERWKKNILKQVKYL
jgi:predicted nucleotidyltransferase